MDDSTGPSTMSPPPAGSEAGRWSRRRFLQAAGATAVGLVAVGAGVNVLPSSTREARHPAAPATPSPTPAPPPTRQVFRSRPDLEPQIITVGTSSPGLAPGYIFCTPSNGNAPDGPTIVDNAGNLIWLRPDNGFRATNFRVSTYRGEPVLTWWEGQIGSTHGEGSYVIADASYREIARVQAGNGYQGDLHEFILTPQGTALFTIFGNVPDYMGPWSGPLLEGVVQEVDIATGRVLFEWHTSAEIGFDESYAGQPGQPDQAFDYIHINSIDVDADGGLIVSGRHTWTIYKVDRDTGRIIWRLGGKKSDFSLGPDVQFYWQHDARIHPDGVLTVFDDGSAGGSTNEEPASRVLTLQLDTAAMTASVTRALTHPDGLLATSQGNVEVLTDGGVFVGWGSLPYFSEFGPDGTLRYDAHFPQAPSYRAFRFPWVGRPTDTPAAVAVKALDGRMTVYASWNGATDVASWEVLVGSQQNNLRSAGALPRTGFETSLDLPDASAFVAVVARDAAGATLGRSDPVAVT